MGELEGERERERERVKTMTGRKDKDEDKREKKRKEKTECHDDKNVRSSPCFRISETSDVLKFPSVNRWH